MAIKSLNVAILSLLLLASGVGLLSVSAGPMIIGGDDLDDHGSYTSGANQLGWLYIQKALAKMHVGGCITRCGNDGTIAALGCTNSTATSSNGGGAIHYAAGAIPKTVNYYTGAALSTFFANLGACGGPAILYIPSPASGVANGISPADVAVLAANAIKILAFVNSGGGLMAHISSSADSAWLSTLLPGITVVNFCDNTTATLTSAGVSAFPGLSNTDIRSGPCHVTFAGNLNGLTVLATDSTTRNLVIGGDCTAIIGSPSCLSITNRSLECISTNGVYAWNFCVTNQTADPIGFLSFPNLPASVTIQSNILQFLPALQPGQGTCLTINITNKSGPTNLCFIVGAHATNFVQCCAITNCLTFTPCCAFIFHETVAAVPGAANCFNYTFTLRNVSTQATSFVYLIPDPFGTCLNFGTNNIIQLTPPLPPGQQRIIGPIRVCVTPACPAPRCFLVSLQNSNLVQCCTARHCLPAPTVGPIVIGDPLDGTVFLTPAIIPLSVNLSGDIVFSSVRYRVTDSFRGTEQVVGTNSVPPFSFIWSNAPPGDYVLQAEGVETLGGGVWISDPVSIYIRTDQDAAGAVGPALLAPAAVGGNDHFSLQTRAGVSYVVECSATILWPDWHPLQVIVGTGGVIPLSQSYTNTLKRFYRVRVQQ